MQVHLNAIACRDIKLIHLQSPQFGRDLQKVFIFAFYQKYHSCISPVFLLVDPEFSRRHRRMSNKRSRMWFKCWMLEYGRILCMWLLWTLISRKWIWLSLSRSLLYPTLWWIFDLCRRWRRTWWLQLSMHYRNGRQDKSSGRWSSVRSWLPLSNGIWTWNWGPVHWHRWMQRVNTWLWLESKLR